MDESIEEKLERLGKTERYGPEAKAKANGSPPGDDPSPDNYGGFERDARDFHEQTSAKGSGEELPELNYIDPARDFVGPVPQRDEILPGVAIRENVGILNGDGSGGKSFLLQQAVSAGAFGLPWLDRPARFFRTLSLFAEEDAAELYRRQIDLNNHFGREMKDLAGKVRYIGEGDEENILVRFDPRSNECLPTLLLRQLEAMIADFKPDLVTLDPAAELYEGNENVRNQVRRFVSILRRMGRRHNCGILLSMHPSLQGLSSGSGTSGSTGWNNSARLRSYLTIPNDEPIGSPKRSLQTMKANYGQAGGVTDIHWQAGAYVVDVPPISSTGNVVDVIALDLLLADIVREKVRNGDRIAASHDARNGFANAVRKDDRAKHLPQETAIAAQARMEAAGKLVRVEMKSSGHTYVYLHTPDQRYPGQK